MPLNIPQEILDKIIDEVAGSYPCVGLFISQEGSQSLGYCALVAKAWTFRGQKHLFVSISLKPENLGSWCEINARNPGLLNRHVRLLEMKQNDGPGSMTKFTPDTLEAARPYLTFPNLELFALSHWDDLATFSLPRTFEHYAIPSLRSFHIIYSISSADVLLELAAIFSYVDEFEIYHPYANDPRVTKTFSFPDFIGWKEFRMISVDKYLTGVLDVISGLSLQCQVLDISYECLDDPLPIMRLISACSATLKYMRLEQTYKEEPCPGISLSLLPKLEGLTLCSAYLSEDLGQPDMLKLDVLGSIICPKLRSITITHNESRMYADKIYDFGIGDWPTVDKFLVKLAETTESRLMVVLRLTRPFNRYNMAMIEGFLPAFRKVGDFAAITCGPGQRS